MPMSRYPGGFRDGISIRGVPLVQTHPGRIYWVYNGTALADDARAGSNGNRGTFHEPFASVDYAVGSCTAGRGDIIFVKPGHAETITLATQLILDVAGIAIIGLGVGSARPTLTFATNTTANIPITAANVSLKNLLFLCNKAAVVSAFTATGTATPTDFTVEGCEFRDLSASLNLLTVITGNATANSLDGLWFCDNRISSMGTTAATTAIKLLEATRRVTINRNFGNWAVLNDTAAMLAGSTFNHTDLEFGWNILNRPNTSSTGGSFVSGSGTAWTGHAHDNYCWQLDNDAGIWIVATTKLAFSQNFSPITGAAEKSGLINPAAV